MAVTPTRIVSSIGIVLALLVPVTHAQNVPVGPVALAPAAPLSMGLPGTAGLSSLLDPKKFSMQHSYSFAMLSDGQHTLGGGMYLNTMQYRVSEPLLLRLKWGVSQLSGSESSPAARLKPELVMPGVELWYRPSKNFVMHLEYSAAPYLFDQAPYRNHSSLSLFGE
jgi:hypothetical protein